MTILYKVESRREFGNAKEGNVFPHKVVLCAVSARNIIAFSALQNLSSHVYVCDIVTPWQYYKVCNSKSLINVLEWNANGEQLLLGYIGGRVEIWQPKEQSLNVWQLQFHANIPNEDIIQAKFFHNGKGVIFNTQKKDHTYYGEKFERLEQRPTLTGFGGVATEGCILLTSSGLLAAFTLPQLQKLAINNNNSGGQAQEAMPHSNASSEQVELFPATHSIGISRSYIEHCSIVASASGALNIAYSTGWQQQQEQQLVYCYKVRIATLLCSFYHLLTIVLFSGLAAAGGRAHRHQIRVAGQHFLEHIAVVHAGEQANCTAAMDASGQRGRHLRGLQHG